MAYLAVFAALVACVSALATPTYVLHERSGHRHGWKRGESIEPNAIVPVRIGLKQQNLHMGYDRVMEVAHPSSAQFGKHLSAEEVHDIFAPSIETVKAVTDWLLEAGIEETKILRYENKGWLGIDLHTEEAENLFRTRFYEHENAHGDVRLGCDEYYVPGHLSEHIDYITPGVKLSAPVKKSIKKRENVGHGWGPRPNPPHFPPGHWGPWHMPPGAATLPPNLRHCARSFTTVCYRALYDIPNAYEKGLNVPGNSLGLYESLGAYSQQDLNLYFKTYAKYIPKGTSPIVDSIDGGTAPVPPGSLRNFGESNIDLAITLSLIYPQNVTVYEVDDVIEALEQPGLFNTFLDALDGSYCNYTAYGITGNSPGVDPVYPDPARGGYKGQLQCGTYKPTRVISISWGEAEIDVSKRYQERQCDEFMKLALQGHSVFFASGDYGVASFPGDDTASGCLSAPGVKQKIYNPTGPACTYVTFVGGTQLQPNQTIKDPESALQTALVPTGPISRFASHGGFSNYFAAPPYQQSAIAEYFANHDPGHLYYTANADASNIGANGGIYNRAGRGIPDVSANGANYRMYHNLRDNYFYGTSLAAPLWASVVTLINEERALIGKGPVGFVNPTLYENPWAMTDIRNGSNPNCGSSGFTAVEGWDPVTGLGTPRYPALLALFMRLP